MLTRSCCCGGCFEVDDCPLPYGGLGDFTYTTTVDINAVAGTFSKYVYDSINVNLNLDPVQCYAYAYDRDECCPTGTPPNCVYPSDTFVEKYWQVMRVESVDTVRRYLPCLRVVSSAKSLPQLVMTVRCTDDKRITAQQCVAPGPVCPSPCAEGLDWGALVSFQSQYAGRIGTTSGLCGEVSVDLEPRFTFGALTKSGGQFTIKRNSLTTFDAVQTGGTGPTGMVYLHRANICPGGQQSDCGPCTLGGNGGDPCGTGRCCCRSYLQVTLEIKREYQLNGYAWNSTFNVFLPTLGPVQYETQLLTLVYEGPVDERLYRNVATAAQRTFTLLSGTVTGSFNLDAPPLGLNTITLDYCTFDVYGPGVPPVGPNTGSTQQNFTDVSDECEPCQVNTPPIPDALSMEQLERLGIARTIIVTRQTP